MSTFFDDLLARQEEDAFTVACCTDWTWLAEVMDKKEEQEQTQ